MTELNLEHTLLSGQAFRWRLDSEGYWACLLPTRDASGQRTEQLARLRQDAETLFYATAPQPGDLDLLRDYFRLDVHLPTLADTFIAADAPIRPALADFAGLRVLRQDPVECLFSFICTSAAPLYRIRRGIAGLCRNFGEPFSGGEVAGLTHYAFPTISRLAAAEISEMRLLGLGYRARYIKESAQRITERGGEDWLLNLRVLPYAEAKAALLTLPGIGEKIADCICLFSLDKDAAIPIDTHMRRIANRDYLQEIAAKSLTRAAYAQIGDTLRARFGPMAGWAQQYLFYREVYKTASMAATYQDLEISMASCPDRSP